MERKWQSPRPTTENHFWAKVEKTDTCYWWLASLRSGYGQFRVNGRVVLAHRYAYELEHGSIPVGLEIDHLCRNRACVRFSHLEAVTRAMNVARGNAPTGVNARKTHCKWGHSFDGDNLAIMVDGRRRCRTCGRNRQQYPQVYVPNHPMASKNGQAYLHRVVWYDAYGPIPKGHVIHHLNGDKNDSRLENLVMLSSQKHRTGHCLQSSVQIAV